MIDKIGDYIGAGLIILWFLWMLSTIIGMWFKKRSPKEEIDIIGTFIIVGVLLWFMEIILFKR